MATRTSPQGSAGSSPHHISGRIEAMLASTSQFRVGVYQNVLGYQNRSTGIGTSMLAILPKSLAHKRSSRSVRRRPRVQ